MKTKFVDTEITLIGHTAITNDGVTKLTNLYFEAGASNEDILSNVDHAEGLVAIVTGAGRGCYQSYDVPNSRTARPYQYIENIIRQKHGSVLEHASFTFLLENVSRAATHEIVRHRHFSFSQESQRFVVEKRGRDIVAPPTLDRKSPEAEELLRSADVAFDTRDHILSVLRADEAGYSRKQAAEAARAAVPNAAATSLYITGNARSWMEFIDKRDSPAADAEMQEIARVIHAELRDVMPEVFGTEASQLWKGISEQGGVKNNG